MKTCNTCAHWGKEEDQELGVRKCAAVPMLFDSFTWSENFDRRVIRPECANKKAFVQDGSDYYASLRTRADFGCNQWEAASTGSKP